MRWLSIQEAKKVDRDDSLRAYKDVILDDVFRSGGLRQLRSPLVFPAHLEDAVTDPEIAPLFTVENRMARILG